MDERKDVPELKKERLGGIYLYECEHTSQGSLYGLGGVLPVGEHANILLCKHCWQHITSIALTDMLREMIRQGPSPALKIVLNELVDKMANVPSAQRGDPRLASGELTDE